MKVRRVGRIGLLVGLALFLVGAGSVAARSETDTRGPKVVLIVGPAGAATPYYRQLADQAAAAAAKLTPNVVRVYSPDATWEHVKAALQGASVVVYLGHGNGWPSIYRNSLYPPTQNGFGLNPHEGAADAHQYFGEDKIGSADQARAERRRDLQPPLLRQRQHGARPGRGHARAGPAAGRQLRRRVLPGRRRRRSSPTPISRRPTT